MRQGQRLRPAPPLAEVRAYALHNVGRLPTLCRQLHHAGSYPVHTSARVNELLEEVRNRIAGQGIKRK